MNMIRNIGITLTLLASALLAGCGGSGGGGGGVAAPVGPIASTLSFPLQSAYKTKAANGATKTFVVSGSCTGTFTTTSAPANTPAVFELNLTALSAIDTITATLTGAGCVPTLAQTATKYYDISYTPLGFNSVGVNYGVFLVPPTIPVSVLVGGTGVIGTETLYTDSTKAVGNGRVDLSSVVEADTATTAIVNLISKIYNAAGILTATEQDLHRISATGALAPVSVDILYSTGIHLILN